MKHPYEDRLLTYKELKIFLFSIDSYFWKNFAKYYTDSFNPYLDYEWIIISKSDLDENRHEPIFELKRRQKHIEKQYENGGLYSNYIELLRESNPECTILIKFNNGLKKGSICTIEYLFNIITNRDLITELKLIIPKKEIQ